ncbi:hypothetical protein OV203_44235 [Nannocystis sp. ILAH1]|uniref:hypothetical protein n=1 Tax=Nannocystis sp. ILAH1 TaxID=2996789 RepID=UPI002271E945|nr:hypothetical protein [Nannocystis sp. ILAH1]MCY0994221.1 hypothetical protein [Nannocystis sp. ILAH1]
MSFVARVSSSACALLFFTAACGDDTASAPESAVCPADAPTRLWAAPADQTPALNGHLQDLAMIGDTLYFRWGTDIPTWRMYAADLCGDEVVLLDPTDDLVDRFMLSGTDAVGRIAFGFRYADGAVVRLDRLEVEGIDEPVEVGRFGNAEPAGWSAGVDAMYFTSTPEVDGEWVPVAAGLGARPLTLWRLGGDPGDVLERLPGEFIDVAFPDTFAGEPAGAGPALTLTDAGELRVYDLQGDEVAAIDQVRRAQRAPGGSRIVWQQIGDDEVEATFVRDLATGVDLELTPNAHTAISWGRLDFEQRLTGTWHWVDDDWLGLVGPDDTLVAVHDAATGEAIEVPAHARVLAGSTHGFWLQLPSADDETVAALWNPRDGELFEWYRQSSTYPFIRLPMIVGDDWYYLRNDQNNHNRGSWWRIDRTTGAWTELLPTLGVPFHELEDGRIVTSLDNTGDAYVRLAVVDLDTRVYTTIAEDVVYGFVHEPEHGVYYLDAQGPGLGLWVAPLPEASTAPRSRREPGLRSGGPRIDAAQYPGGADLGPFGVAPR